MLPPRTKTTWASVWTCRKPVDIPSTLNGRSSQCCEQYQSRKCRPEGGALSTGQPQSNDSKMVETNVVDREGPDFLFSFLYISTIGFPCKWPMDDPKRYLGEKATPSTCRCVMQTPVGCIAQPCEKFSRIRVPERVPPGGLRATLRSGQEFFRNRRSRWQCLDRRWWRTSSASLVTIAFPY